MHDVFENVPQLDREIQSPLLDINYGWGDRIQLKYQGRTCSIATATNPCAAA